MSFNVEDSSGKCSFRTSQKSKVHKPCYRFGCNTLWIGKVLDLCTAAQNLGIFFVMPLQIYLSKRERERVSNGSVHVVHVLWAHLTHNMSSGWYVSFLPFSFRFSYCIRNMLLCFVFSVLWFQLCLYISWVPISFINALNIEWDATKYVCVCVFAKNAKCSTQLNVCLCELLLMERISFGHKFRDKLVAVVLTWA